MFILVTSLHFFASGFELKKVEMDFIPLLSTLAKAFWAADILLFVC